MRVWTSTSYINSWNRSNVTLGTIYFIMNFCCCCEFRKKRSRYLDRLSTAVSKGALMCVYNVNQHWTHVGEWNLHFSTQLFNVRVQLSWYLISSSSAGDKEVEADFPDFSVSILTPITRRYGCRIPTLSCPFCKWKLTQLRWLLSKLTYCR